MCIPIPQKTYNITKRLKKPEEELEKYFSDFMTFTDCTEQQQIPRPVDKRRRKMYYLGGKKKRHTIVKNHLTVNNHGYIIHKANHKKGRMHDYNINKKNHPVTPKDVVKMCMILDI